MDRKESQKGTGRLDAMTSQGGTPNRDSHHREAVISDMVSFLAM
jgi:hypothetical protein